MFDGIVRKSSSDLTVVSGTDLITSMTITLTEPEYDSLCQQDPATANDGGYQSLLVGFQRKTDEATRELTLTQEDIDRIHKYAFDYKQGGWQERLKNIFGRTLGENLDGKNT